MSSYSSESEWNVSDSPNDVRIGTKACRLFKSDLAIDGLLRAKEEKFSIGGMGGGDMVGVVEQQPPKWDELYVTSHRNRYGAMSAYRMPHGQLQTTDAVESYGSGQFEL
jgi:hypothetical protein